MSPCWFAVQFHLTQTHEVDAVIVDYAGKLRYNLQNVAVMYLMSNLEGRSGVDDFHVDAGRDTYEVVDDIVDGLSGAKQVPEVPVVLDENVKDALLEFRRKFDLVKEYRSMVPDMSVTEMRQVVLEINDVTMYIDNLVRLAREGANVRVQEIFWVAIARAVVSASWTCLLFCIIGNMWKHYYEAHTSLECLHKRETALLNTMSDVVVTVQGGKNFEVLETNDKLDHLVGTHMQGRNILECAAGNVARLELERFLVSALSSHLPNRTFKEWVRSSWWWNLMPPRVEAVLPLAPMIRTTWSCWRPDAPDTVELELMSMPIFEEGTGAIILAIRVAMEVTTDAVHPPEGAHLARALHPEIAAIRARVEEDELSNPEQRSHSQTESTNISLPHRQFRIVVGGRSESAGSSHTVPAGEASPLTVNSDFATPPPTMYGVQVDSRQIQHPGPPQFRADRELALHIADRLAMHGARPSTD